jgi:lipopolysaccharide export system protein LptC
MMLKKIFNLIPLPWLLVLLLAGLFFGLSFSPTPDSNQTINEDTSGFPQFFMKNVQTREFDATGRLRYELNTPSIAHFQLHLNNPGSEDYTQILQPRLNFYQENNPPWTITANQGRSENNGELIRLVDQVVLSQQSVSQGLVQIMTEELRATPAQQFVETDKAVKIRAEQTQIDAIGLSANLATDQLQLNSQVEAVYEPRR